MSPARAKVPSFSSEEMGSGPLWLVAPPHTAGFCDNGVEGPLVAPFSLYRTMRIELVFKVRALSSGQNPRLGVEGEWRGEFLGDLGRGTEIKLATSL